MSLGGGLAASPVVMHLYADIKEFKAKMAEAGTELKTLEAEGSTMGTRMRHSFKSAAVGMGLLAVGIAALSIHAAAAAESAKAGLDQALKNVGQDSEKTQKQIESVVNQMNDLGFTGEEVYGAMRRLTVAFGDVNSAQHLMGLTANVAAMKHQGLEETATTLSRAAAGNAKAFKEFGITLDATLPKADGIKKAMGQLAEKTDGMALAASTTLTGSLKVMGAQFDEAAVGIGQGIAPALKIVVNGLKLAGKWAKEHSEVLSKVLVGALGLVTVAFIQMAIANAAASWEILLAIAAIVAIGAAIGKFWDESQDFRNALVSTFQLIVDFLATVLKAVSFIIQAIAYSLDKVVGALAAIGSAMGDETSANILNGIGDGLRWVGDNAGYAVDHFNDMSKALKKGAEDSKSFRFSSIGGNVSGFLADIGYDPSKIKTPALDAAKAATGAAATATSKAVSQLGDQIKLFSATFAASRADATGNLDAMGKVAIRYLEQAKKLREEAVAEEKKTRNTKLHTTAMNQLTAATKAYAVAQTYAKNVAQQAARANDDANSAATRLMNTYAASNSYLAAQSRVSGFDQQSSYVEVPVIIDGQVLFRATQKVTLQNNRRNATNGLATSGSVI